MISIKKALSFLTNNNYSTGEIKTGKKWIDGKPIYKKVVTWTGTIPTGTASKDIAHGITNLDTVLTCHGVMKYYNGTIYPLSYIGIGTGGTTITATTIAYITGTNVRINTSVAWADTTTVYCVLEYTKTTDTVKGGGYSKLASMLNLFSKEVK